MYFETYSKSLSFVANRVVGPAFAIVGFTIAAHSLLTEALPNIRDAVMSGAEISLGLMAVKVLLPAIIGWFGIQLMRVRKLGLWDSDSDGR